MLPPRSRLCRSAIPSSCPSSSACADNGFGRNDTSPMGVRTDADGDGFETGSDCGGMDHPGTTQGFGMEIAQYGWGQDASFAESNDTSAWTTAPSTLTSSVVYYERIAYTD